MWETPPPLLDPVYSRTIKPYLTTTIVQPNPVYICSYSLFRAERPKTIPIQRIGYVSPSVLPPPLPHHPVLHYGNSWQARSSMRLEIQKRKNNHTALANLERSTRFPDQLNLVCTVFFLTFCAHFTYIWLSKHNQKKLSAPDLYPPIASSSSR